MTHPLTGQRSRREQIAELYDSHAAGLFVYCADQLGDLGSAADVLASVLTSAPEEPPRAALYAFARREIHRRDVVFAPPVVDPLIDPASALVERILRELRPQQREVLVLGHVCGLDLTELAWVLDVASDTAEELALSAAHRFRQMLDMALTASAPPVPKPVADVYGALAVAPLRDVLGRLPWPEPPGPLRIHLAGSSTAEPAPLFTKPRWPVPPAWPQPLGDADPATTSGLFPRDLLTPPPPSHVPDHDATTTPMPKFRDDVREGPAPLAAFDAWRATPASLAPFEPLKAPSEALTENPAAPKPFEAFRPKKATQPGPARPTPRGAAPGMGEPPLAAPVGFLTGGDVLDDPPPADDPAPPASGDFLLYQGPAVREASPLFTPRERPREPVYRMPLAPAPQVHEPLTPPHTDRPGTDGSAATGPDTDGFGTTGSPTDDLQDADGSLTVEAGTNGSHPDAKEQAKARPAVRKPRPKGRRPHPAKGRKKKRRNRHHDWAWELIGFLICVAIAMIVFFSMPMIIKP